MRTVSTIIFMIAFSTIFYGQACKKKYKDKLETNSKLIACGANYTIEKLNTGECVLKRYYPETKAITQIVTYKNDELKEKHGFFQENYDDGTTVNKGKYKNDLKTGPWILGRYQSGEFVNDEKVGKWTTGSSDLEFHNFENYKNGQLHGKAISYDSIGNIIIEKEYEYGELILTTEDTSIIISEEFPRFAGCEDLNLSEEQLNQCSKEKLLNHIGENLKYPRKARRLNIQGKAIIQFVVDTDGSLIDLEVLNGVSRDLENVAVNLIRGMPKWNPGMQNGKPVKVLFTLPITFRLN